MPTEPLPFFDEAPPEVLHDVPAPAKLNLFLHVTGRRPDGYHELESVFVLIDWCDTLHFERSTSPKITREDLGETLPELDLCLRAAMALQAASGTQLGAHIRIEKHIPWGAGMGGGSSDAASTLLALNRLWGLGWSRQALIRLATPLGADIPFFLGGTPAWVEGIGEQLTPIDPTPARYVVLKPAVSLATREIFSSQRLSFSPKAGTVAGFAAADKAQALDPQKADFYGRNDLQDAAAHASLEVQSSLNALSKQFGHSRMTGSGSAVFSRLALEDEVDVSSLESFEGCRVRVCKSLALHPLRHWAHDETA